MAILDYFKKDSLESEDMQKLKEELELMQKNQEEEKTKWEKLQQEEREKYENALNEQKNKYAEIEKTTHEMREQFENEKLLNRKELAVINKLAEDGANPKLVNLLKKEIKFDEIEFTEDGNLANWETVTAPIKNQYSDFFTGAETKGLDPVKPLETKKEEKDPFVDGFNS